MKFITGFFMAWGNFITLPCPYKKWDNSLKNMMLAFLPSVGAVVGLLWVAIIWLLGDVLRLPEMLLAVVAEFYIFYVHGFMHLDGFMDSTDAIMSRRPLEDRQRIMKDSNVGSFAVVMVAFLLIAWFAALTTYFRGGEYFLGSIFLIPVISRCLSGGFVLTYKPIGHSQYVEDSKDPDRWKYRTGLIIQMVIYFALAASASVIANNGYLITEDVVIMAVMTVVEALAAYVACSHGRKQLGGISGDIAGYTIVWAELVGIMTLVILKSTGVMSNL
ncbi:MAG: adenosylcobinamide-GDP ribazoletransferase [Eubacteriales bacterium]|nr:adenosylcobinamide-GDP ribazoletransferase [Eubacteriales bacterium]